MGLLGEFLRRRAGLIHAPLRDANAIQGLLDAAPVGSVGAPGGLLPNPNGPSGRDNLTELGSLLSFAPGIGDAAGLATDIRTLMRDPSSRTPFNFAMSGLGVLPFIPAMTVFHGSPHKFDAFDMSKIGTGEGAQAYGHGLYFAENPKVARQYTKSGDNAVLIDGKSLANRKRYTKLPDESRANVDLLLRDLADGVITKNDLFKYAASIGEDYETAYKLVRDAKEITYAPASLYTVDIPDEAIDKMLDWDAPLSEQPEAVRRVLQPLIEEMEAVGHTARNGPVRRAWANPDGATVYNSLSTYFGGLNSGMPEVSHRLQELGIPGIKYYDGGSRAAGQGTRNFVVFDDKLPKILKRE